MAVILFEDELAAQLEPVTLGRPAFAISCGSLRLVDLAAKLEQPVAAVVRSHLSGLVAEDYPGFRCPTEPVSGEPALWVNARAVPSAATLAALRSLLAGGRPGAVRGPTGTAAALVPASARWLSSAERPLPADDFWDQLALPAVAAEIPLFEYPHDIIRHHQAILADNLEQRLARGDYREIANGVFAAEGASLGAYCTTEAARGPIVLDRGATVGPYCYLSGPVYVGPQARVIEHAALKDGAALGHTTKIGGEVEASIVEPYTNKQHHGFLGHSYLGSWINLGAGTCNSDLKNTYGPVNVEYRGQKVATGMQFVGTIMGDYAKTAINTGIFTGKVIGACSMMYGFVTTNVPSFTNYARLFGQVTTAPVEVLVATQRRMFARRGVQQRPCDIQLLHDMHALTEPERKLLGELLSLEPLSL